MSFCVNWSLWKERRKARIRCARNVSEAMPEKGKKKDKEKTKGRKAFRSQCWFDVCEGGRKRRRFGLKELKASAQFQETFSQVSGKSCTQTAHRKSPASQEWACTSALAMLSLARSTHRKCSLRPNVAMDPEGQRLGHHSTMLPATGDLSSILLWP